MSSMYLVYSIARYEFKRLSRNNAFRIILTFVTIGIILSNYFLFIEKGVATYIRIPSSIPYFNFLFLNLFQSIIVLMFGTDFLKTDLGCDTSQALYTRPLSNLEYITGKSLGIIAVFVLYDLFIMILTLGINALFIPDTPIAFSAHFLYLILFVIPTLVFTFGLSVFVMVLLRIQNLTIFLLLGYTAISTFYLKNKVYSIFNFTAHYIFEVYSDFIGFGNMKSILMHRGIYFFLGLGFIILSAIIFRRPRQSKQEFALSILTASILICGSVLIGGAYINHFSTGKTLRSNMAVLNNQIGNKKHITVTDCLIDLVHNRYSINVEANITVTNTTDMPLDTFHFSLNPGLDILEITENTIDLLYSRNLHIITINPPTPLQPGDRDTLIIRYQGTINENACYVDIDDTRRTMLYGYSFYNFSKQYGFIQDDYILLTPETLWYPVAGIPFGAIYPKPQKKDFIHFRLSVTTKDHLTAIAQGEMQRTDKNTCIFKPETPLPHMSLVIGKYETHSIVVDDIEYRAYLKPGHDYISPAFTKLRGEKLREWIRSQKNDLERSFGGTYPYNRFSFIEVPVHFFAFNRAWSGESQAFQPEMVLVPEKGSFYGINFEYLINETIESYGDRFTLQEIEESELESFIHYILLSLNYYVDPFLSTLFHKFGDIY